MDGNLLPIYLSLSRSLASPIHGVSFFSSGDTTASPPPTCTGPTPLSSSHRRHLHHVHLSTTRRHSPSLDHRPVPIRR
ncbi:hypothetical protein U1Q18_026004 [Sarracenia purpurea var. burkii]